MNRTLQIAIMSALLVAGQGAMLPQVAVAQEAAVQDYRIPAGDLDGALRQYAAQNKLQLVYPAELVSGKRSNGLSGSYSQGDALQRLLAGTGLQAQPINARTIGLKPAQVPQPPPAGGQQAGQPARDRATAREPTTLRTMMVTGSRIRGGATASPTISIGVEGIREEGFTDLGEVIRSLPQNFNGGQNPGVTSTTSGISGVLANQNVTGGSGLNLRGLGPDATLTLLNGRRMSYGGFAQAVDISAIPLGAVDRIEIVTDGASAIYGSDAVGGVGNVILKRDFQGVTVGARRGFATQGGMDTREYTATMGGTWRGGGAIVSVRDASADPIYANQRAYTQFLQDPWMLYAGNEVRSGLLSAYQSLGGRVELRLDALGTLRDQSSNLGYPAMYLQRENDVSTLLLSPSLEFSLPNDWVASIGGSWGKDETTSVSTTVARATGISTLESDQCYCNHSRVYELGAEGPVLSLRGGEVRLAVGAGYRMNDFVVRNRITGIGSNAGEQSSRFAYGEIDLPLVAPGSNMAGVYRLALSAAIRGEDYDSFGGVVTPKLGLIYGPSADYTLKASWGRSYKAPTLYEQNQLSAALLYPANALGAIGYPADATALMTYGGNADLGPERAVTWSASLSFHPRALPGLETELTLFDVDYTDRVVTPTNTYHALSNPAYAEFVEPLPAAARQAQVIAAFERFYNYSGFAYDPGKVVAIVFNQLVNAKRQRIRGVDLSGSYGFDLGDGRLTLRGSSSWLDSTQQTTSGQASQALSGTIFNPARFNGRLGAVWTRGGLTASAFASYTGGVRNIAPVEKTASFTTFDTTLRYEVGDRDNAWSGIEFSLSAQNVFDRAPPSYTVLNANYAPYDSTNSSAIGRFVAFSVSKHW